MTNGKTLDIQGFFRLSLLYRKGIAMAVQFWKGNTPFPKWFWVLNPLCGKAFFGAVTAMIPGSGILNGISYANMGLSSVILFSAVLCTMGKMQNK